MTAPKKFSICRTCGNHYRPKKRHWHCSDICRFEECFEKTAGCWIWQRAIGTHGYGHFYYKGAGRTASSASYCLYVSEVPVGQFVCHTCDNRKCVNPDHLFLGTQTDNMRDMVKKNRDRRRKLSDREVIEIRARLKMGQSLRSLARAYGVANQNIVHIKKGRTFRHLIP